MKILNSRGQSLIEYLLLTALIAIAAMGIVRVMGHSISARLADVTNAIQGYQGRRVEVERVQTGDYSKKDMSNFMQGAVQRGRSGSADGGSDGE
jgi:Flp pilus assembly pilin Flp